MKKIIFVIMLILWAGIAWGADICIRDGGTGDGSAWDNALDALPATLTRGNTYWIADGTYAPYTFDDAQSGYTNIFITKATADSHGVATGWDNAYGDGTALFTGTGDIWTVRRGHYVFNGVSATNDTSGHGFKLAVTGDDAKGIRLCGPSSWTLNMPDSLEFRYIEIAQQGLDTENDDDGIYTSGSDDDGFCRDVLLSHLYVHDAGRVHVLTRECREWVIEHCWFARNSSSDAKHSESYNDALSDSMTIRYCTFVDIEGTAVIALENNAPIGSNNFSIYGNLFYNTYGNPFNREGLGNGAIVTATADYAYNTKIFNNTFVNLSVSGNSGISITHGTGGIAYNNLWFDCEAWATLSGITYGYNWFVDTVIAAGSSPSDTDVVQDSTRVFTDLAGYDFTLYQESAVICTTLASPFNADPTGATRGEDGHWDSGYVELDDNPGEGEAGTLTYYVKEGESGTGTYDDPFGTIAGAEAVADSNDVIVMDGTLPEKITASAHGITYRGWHNASPPRIGGRVSVSGFASVATTVTDSITTPLQDGTYNPLTRTMSTAGSQELFGYTNSGQIANGWLCFVMPALTNFSSWDSFKVRLFSLSNTGIPVLRIKTAKGYLKYTTQDTTRYKAMQVESASRDSILWNNTDPAVNTWYFAPELASILPSLAQNDTLTVLFNNESSTNDTRINVEMTENANANQARIYYQYSTTGGGVPFYLVPAANRSFTRVWKSGVKLTQAATHAALEAGKFYRSASGDSLFVVAADTTGIEIDGLGATVDMNEKNGVTVRNIVVNGIGSGGPVVKLSGNNGLVAHVFIDSAKVGIYAYGDSNRVLNSVFAFEDTAKTDTGDDNEFDYNATLTGSKTLGGAHDITLASYDPDNPPEAVRDKGLDVDLPFNGSAPEIGPVELAELVTGDIARKLFHSGRRTPLFVNGNRVPLFLK